MGEVKHFTDADEQRSYHLERVTRKFKYLISPENAEILVHLLGLDDDKREDATLSGEEESPA